MVSSGILRRVALVRTDVSEKLNASFIRVTRIGELGTTLAVTSNRHMLRRISEPTNCWNCNAMVFLGFRCIQAVDYKQKKKKSPRMLMLQNFKEIAMIKKRGPAFHNNVPVCKSQK
jgi:hypothetical protein